MIEPNSLVAKAKIDPEGHFDSPMDVVKDDRFSFDEKREILESWELDARELQTAEAENMAGGEKNDLAEVRMAIRQLEESAPSR